MKNTLKILILIVIIISGCTLIEIQEEENDGYIDCKTSDNSVDFKSFEKNKTSNGKLSYELELNFGISKEETLFGKIEHKTELKTNKTSMKSTQIFKLELLELFSFIPTTDSGYNGENKTVSITIGNNNQSTIQNFNNDTSNCKNENGTISSRIIANFSTNGSIAITFNFGGSNFELGDLSLSNDSFNLNLSITDFPFNNSETECLAINIIFSYSSSISEKTTDIEDNSFFDFVTNTSFQNTWNSWLSNYNFTNQNGTSITVNTSSISQVLCNGNPTNEEEGNENGEYCNQVYMTFIDDKPSVITWDPRNVKP